MAQANIDLGVLQKTNITERIYTRELAGYRVVASDVTIRHCRGVDIFYQELPHVAVEGH